MWPFSSGNEKKPSDWDERLAEFERRLKLIEREHDDLHAAYRKLRASAARGQVGEGQPNAAHAASEVVDSKQALRDRYLPKPGRGNGT
jgi:hypothetical protein